MVITFKTVKIPAPEYNAMRALSKDRGILLQRLIADAIRLYLSVQKEGAK